MEEVNVIYDQCCAEYEIIVSQKITDEDRIEAIMDQLWLVIDDKRCCDLYWEIINYVESYDPSGCTTYRRIAKIYFTGY